MSQSTNPQLTPRPVTELFDVSLFFYREHLSMLLLPVALLYLPLMLVQQSLEAFWLKPLEVSAYSGSIDSNVLQFFLATLGRFLLGSPRIGIPGAVSLCAMGVITAPVILYATDNLFSRTTEPKRLVRIILRRLPALIISAVTALFSLFGLLIFLLTGFVFLGAIAASLVSAITPDWVGAILFFLISLTPIPLVAACAGKWFILTAPIILLEGKGAFQSIVRNAELTRNTKFRATWATAIGVPLIVFGLQLLSTIGVQQLIPLSGATGITQYLLEMSSLCIGSLFFVPYGAIVITQYYFDLRMRGEGLDIYALTDSLKQHEKQTVATSTTLAVHV